MSSDSTAARQARRFRDHYDHRADATAWVSNIADGKAKAWAKFERALRTLEKHGCLDNLTVTINGDAATVKVGDRLPEVVEAADLPVGTQLVDDGGDLHVVSTDGLHLVHDAATEAVGGGPFTVTYVPPTLSVVLDQLPDDMAEGSVVLSSKLGALVFRPGEISGCAWRDTWGTAWTDKQLQRLGTLTLLYDAGARK